jgi:hypothetical protein
VSSISFFDEVFQANAPVVDSIFGKSYGLRWAGTAITLTAILSAHPINFDSEGDVVETTHSHNFEVTAAALTLGQSGAVILPQPGMQFTDLQADGTNAVYEVVKRDDGRCYDPVDNEATRLLVYAKLIRRSEKT